MDSITGGKCFFFVLTIALLVVGTDISSSQMSILEVSGTWAISETIGETDCEEESGTLLSYDLDVVQSGDTLTVTSSQGTFKGSIFGNQLTWSGSYPEGGGTTSTKLDLTISEDGRSLRGLSFWTWMKEDFTCSGTSEVTGTLTEAERDESVSKTAVDESVEKTATESPAPTVDVVEVDEVKAEEDISNLLVLEPDSSITISSPSEKDVLTLSRVRVSGTAESGVKPTGILVATREGINRFTVAGGLRWEGTVELSPGRNDIIVRGVDSEGGTVKNVIRVFYMPPDVVDAVSVEKVPELLNRVDLNRRLLKARLSEVSRIEKDRYKIDRETMRLEKASFEIKRSVKAGVAEAAAGEMEDITIEEFTEVPVELGLEEKTDAGLSEDEELVGSFVRLESNLADIEWAIVKIEFTDEEIRLRKLLRERLFMVWYDENDGRWVRLRRGNPDWVNDVGINKTGGYVWANVSHFSVFGVGGQVAAQTETPPPTTLPPTTEPPVTSAPTEPPLPSETLPATHFPEETPRPTLTRPPLTIGEEAPSTKDGDGGRRIRRPLLLVIILIALLVAAYLLMRKKPPAPAMEESEKDILAEEELPPDDNSYN